MWMETETQFIVPRLELTLSKRPWLSAFSFACPALIWINNYWDVWTGGGGGEEKCINVNVPTGTH